MKKFEIGVDVRKSGLLCGLFDKEMHLVRVIQRPNDPENAAVSLVERLEACVRELVAGAQLQMEEIAGAGIALPPAEMTKDAHLEMTVEAALSEALGMPVWANSRTAAAALAEHRAGAGRGSRHMVYVEISDRPTCAFVLNGELFRGVNGMAGDMSCLHLDASGTAESAQNGAGYISQAVGVLQKLLDVHVFVFGGSFPKPADAFLETLRARLGDVRILTAEMGDNAALVGAALMVK